MMKMNIIVGKDAKFAVIWDNKTVVIPVPCELRAQCLGEHTLGYARFYKNSKEFDSKRCCMHCAAAEVFRLAGYP